MNSYEALNVGHLESEIDSFTEERYRQFYKYCPTDTESVLDVGCNTGRGGRVLKVLNKKLAISGLDIVEDRLNRLPDDVYTEKLLGVSTDIPVEDESFDAVCAGEFVEHLYPADVDKSLAEFFRVLKIGGRLLLTTPNPSDIKRRVRGQTVLGGPHVSQHHADALKFRLRMTGFSRVRVYGSGKVSRYLGYHFPLLSVYGSYLVSGQKF